MPIDDMQHVPENGLKSAGVQPLKDSVQFSVLISESGGRRYPEDPLGALIAHQRDSNAIGAASIADFNLNGLAADIADNDDLVDDFRIDRLRVNQGADRYAGAAIRCLVDRGERSGHSFEPG